MIYGKANPGLGTVINLAMNEWGEEVFRTLAYKYIFQREVPG